MKGTHQVTHEFDRNYWEQHWEQAPGSAPDAGSGRAPNPYLVSETGGLARGTALDAGCGEGAEAIWLASRGWRVTAADISSEALTRAAGGAPEDKAALVQWVQADLSVWDPGTPFDLVTTSYAHPAMPQLEFYDRISGWVAPGGTLLVVGHLHTPGATGHGHHPPAEASVGLADITARLDGTLWEIVTAEEHTRTVTGPQGQANSLHDVVVRAARRP
ncbi:MAG: class I SAM-dependent methyltransferase [Nocardioides sp.]